MCSGRTRLAFAFVLLGGCSQLFGLESPDRAPDATVIKDNDTDGDGIFDMLDNCVEVKNPDQLDVDNDTVGDACQGCVTLPLRPDDDDDGDNLSDTVDNCTGQITAQLDTDGDGIGNECDARVGKDTRYCMWTFRPAVAGEDAAIWTSSWQLGTSFEIRDSQIKHQSSMMLDVATLRDATFEAPEGIAFDTRAHLKAFTAPLVLGVAIELQTSVSTLYACQVVQPSTGNGHLELTRDGVVVDTLSVFGTIPTPVTSYVRMSAGNDGGVMRVNCTMDIDGLGVGNLHADLPPGLIKVRPRLLADRATVDFDHVTVYKLGI